MSCIGLMQTNIIAPSKLLCGTTAHLCTDVACVSDGQNSSPCICIHPMMRTWSSRSFSRCGGGESRWSGYEIERVFNHIVDRHFAVFP
eukprot:6208390-Pleurochrysis_carterae.AAC.2